MDTTLTIRTSKKIKASASKILEKKGLSISAVLNMYLRKIAEDKEFEVYDSAFDELTKADIKAIKKAKEEFARGEYFTLADIKKEMKL